MSSIPIAKYNFYWGQISSSQNFCLLTVLSVYFLDLTTCLCVHLDDQEQVLSWETRLQIALDISHGIEYLHDGVCE